LISEVILKVAGMEAEESKPYYPRPSIAGPERCLRQMVYWASNTPRDKRISDRAIVVMNDSSFHETLTEDWLNKTAFRLHSQQMEVEIAELDFYNPPFILKGHIDGIITDMLGFEALYEHKAINYFTHNRYEAGEYPLDYITQCCLYIVGVSKLNPEITKAVLLIKDKNTSAYLDYVIDYDTDKDIAKIVEMSHSNGKKLIGDPEPLFVMENVVQGAIDRFRQVYEYVQNKTLPDRQYEINSWHCEYCQWQETCWAGYEEEYQQLAQDTVLDMEIEDLCRYYLELNAHLKEMEKEKDELKAKIRQVLKAANASKGKAGQYVIHNRLDKYQSLNKEKIPESILKQAMETKYKEVLTIRLIKR